LATGRIVVLGVFDAEISADDGPELEMFTGRSTTVAAVASVRPMTWPPRMPPPIMSVLHACG
jgi:hypothetical protein